MRLHKSAMRVSGIFTVKKVRRTYRSLICRQILFLQAISKTLTVPLKFILKFPVKWTRTKRLFRKPALITPHGPESYPYLLKEKHGAKIDRICLETYPERGKLKSGTEF